MAIELAQDGEKFSGVDTLLERMKTHPEEFFEGTGGLKHGRWAFIYKDYFRDCLTESEKGRIHEALRVVRRLEFDALVVRELMREDIKEQEMAAKMSMASGNYIAGGAISSGSIFGSTVTLTDSGNIGIGTTTTNTLLGPSPFGAVPQKERE